MVAWLLKSVGIGFAVFDLGQGARSFFLSHAVAFKGDAVGVVDDPVEDRVSDGGLADHVVPFGNGQLGGNQGRFAPVALFKDFQEIEALLVIEGVGAPIIEGRGRYRRFTRTKLPCSEPCSDGWDGLRRI